MTVSAVARLRQFHLKTDRTIAVTYGWGDLDLGHSFHETAQGMRYTRVRCASSEPARRQVLGRLLELNHARYAEEVAAGLHEKKKGKAKEEARDEGQLGLF